MRTTVRILLVDDHAVVREGLRRLIESESDLLVVGEANDGRMATQIAPGLHPDVAIVDVAMPGLDGAQTTRLLRQLCPNIKVLVLTVHDDRPHLIDLLESGASGYMLKRSGGRELIQAIRTVAARGVYIDPHVGGLLASTVIGHDGGRPRTKDLSDRESRTLRMIAQGYSNKEIAAALGVSIKTIETHKARAMDKLGLRHRVDIVRHAFRAGWLNEVE